MINVLVGASNAIAIQEALVASVGCPIHPELKIR
jgi:hypothetical protein